MNTIWEMLLDWFIVNFVLLLIFAVSLEIRMSLKEKKK